MWARFGPSESINCSTRAAIVFHATSRASGRTIGGADDQMVAGFESKLPAEIDQHWRGGRAKTCVQVIGRGWWACSIHAQSPRQVECCAELGRRPSNGEPAYPRGKASTG